MVVWEIVLASTVRKQEMADGLPTAGKLNVLEQQNVWLGLVDFVMLPAETLSKENN